MSVVSLYVAVPWAGQRLATSPSGGRGRQELSLGYLGPGAAWVALHLQALLGKAGGCCPSVVISGTTPTRPSLRGERVGWSWSFLTSG